MRLIDADALKTVLGMGDDCAECDKEERKKWVKCQYDRNFTKMDFCGWLDDAPTVDAVPVRRGKWDFLVDNQFRCTCCDAFYTGDQFEAIRLRKDDPYEPNFCPYCGADMREETP